MLAMRVCWIIISNIGKDKSFVDDLNMEQGIVSMRVGLSYDLLRFSPRSLDLFIHEHFSPQSTTPKKKAPALLVQSGVPKVNYLRYKVWNDQVQVYRPCSSPATKSKRHKSKDSQKNSKSKDSQKNSKSKDSQKTLSPKTRQKTLSPNDTSPKTRVQTTSLKTSKSKRHKSKDSAEKPSPKGTGRQTNSNSNKTRCPNCENQLHTQDEQDQVQTTSSSDQAQTPKSKDPHVGLSRWAFSMNFPMNFLDVFSDKLLDDLSDELSRWTFRWTFSMTFPMNFLDVFPVLLCEPLTDEPSCHSHPKDKHSVCTFPKTAYKSVCELFCVMQQKCRQHRTSPVVTHPSTTRAWGCLTSQSERDTVFSA